MVEWFRVLDLSSRFKSSTLPFNRPFPSSKNPHSYNKAKCKTFLVKISFICMMIKNDFHKKGFAFGLILNRGLLHLRNGLLNFISVAPSSTPPLCLVNSQLVCLPPVGILTIYVLFALFVYVFTTGVLNKSTLK